MNKDQVKGPVEQAKGKVKEIAGKTIGSKRLEAEGDAEQVAGKVQKTLGDAKSELQKRARLPYGAQRSYDMVQDLTMR